MKFQKTLLLSGAALAFAVSAGAAFADPVTLTIESWRTDDASVWTDTIIPLFEKAHPDIKVVYAPTNAPDYNAALNAKLAGGTAGDIIICRPFDQSLAMFKAGQLARPDQPAGNGELRRQHEGRLADR